MSQIQPVAQDVCPVWCVADHATQLHPADARHWGDLGAVPAVEILAEGNGSDSHERSVQIDVGLERAFGARVAHVSLVVDESGDRSLLITADTALRLSRALADAASAASQ